jgi:hypothetical protein
LCIPVIPALRRWRKEDLKFRPGQQSETLSQKKRKRKKKRRERKRERI